MNKNTYRGLYVASYTPMDDQGNVHLEAIPALVEFNIQLGVAGFYICGTTGEGMSLTTEERIAVADRFIQAVGGRFPVIIQIGHNSLKDTEVLAAAADASGADGISAHVPTYFKVTDVETAVECSRITAAAAPNRPFFYYHIPSFTGCHISISEYTRVAMEKIPSFRGVKFSDTRVDFLKAAMDIAPVDYGFFFGCDEMLLAGLTQGVPAAVGSTYNLFAEPFNQVISALAANNLTEASMIQAHCSRLIAAVAKYPFHAAMKALLTRSGVPCGTTRLPNKPISPKQVDELVATLASLGFALKS
jgi:N-acetylneuraminate lyase